LPTEPMLNLLLKGHPSRGKTPSKTIYYLSLLPNQNRTLKNEYPPFSMHEAELCYESKEPCFAD
jgi:hypothetical protein